MTTEKAFIRREAFVHAFLYLMPLAGWLRKQLSFSGTNPLLPKPTAINSPAVRSYPLPGEKWKDWTCLTERWWLIMRVSESGIRRA